jgi:hypothetical protein
VINFRVISESEASEMLRDPASHEGGELVEVKDANGSRFIGRVIVNSLAQEFTLPPGVITSENYIGVILVGRLIPDETFLEAQLKDIETRISNIQAQIEFPDASSPQNPGD